MHELIEGCLEGHGLVELFSGGKYRLEMCQFSPALKKTLQIGDVLNSLQIVGITFSNALCFCGALLFPLSVTVHTTAAPTLYRCLQAHIPLSP